MSNNVWPFHPEADLASDSRPVQPERVGAAAQSAPPLQRCSRTGLRGVPGLIRTGTAPSPSSVGAGAPPGLKDSRMSTRRINARAETVHTKPSFGDAFHSRRCLLPANGWFEWQRTGYGKQPYLLALADGSPLSFAAQWERWSKDGESLESFAIITTAASPALADIHDRQPAIIDSDRFDDWLDPTSSVTWLRELVREPRAGLYQGRAVSTRVNSVRNDDPEVLVPMSERGLF